MTFVLPNWLSCLGSRIHFWFGTRNEERTKELKLWSNEPFDVELFLLYSHHSCLVQFLHCASRGRNPKKMLCPVLDRFLPTLAWTIKINGKSHSRWSIPHDLWQHVVLDNWTKFVSSSNAWNTKLGGAPTAPNVAPPAGSPLWRPGSVTLRWWSGAGLPNEHWQGAGHRFWQCPQSAK